MITSKDIKELLSEGEGLMLECKRATFQVPRSFWESYSAFANTLGGYILMGVEEDKQEKDIKKRFSVSGVTDSKAMIDDLWSTLNGSKVNENILLDRDVNVVEVDGREVICVHVPQADWRVRPIYIDNNIYKGSYKRNNEGDFHCTEKEVRAMVRDANEEGCDGVIMDKFTMDDVDLDSLKKYRQRFRILNDEHPWNDVDDKQFLIHTKGYAVDRRKGVEGLTAAGLLLFGKGASVEERFSNFRMDYLDMTNLIGDERYSERLTYDGRWENNLYQFFTRVLLKITMDMPRPFKLNEELRRIDDTPQLAALREAFVNSILHADFFGAMGVLRVEKHEREFVFRNPGNLLIPKSQVYEGGNSKARNPRIQTYLRMIGFGENVGSGFPKILKAWKEKNWKEPKLENNLECQEVKLTLTMSEMYSEASDDEKSVVKEPFYEFGSKKTKKRAKQENIEKTLEIIRLNNTITASKIAEMMNTSARQVQRYLSELQNRKVIERIGADKTGMWKVLDYK